MDLLSPIKDRYSERRIFIGRVVLTSVVSTAMLGLVIARLVQLQVFDYEHFASLYVVISKIFILILIFHLFSHDCFCCCWCNAL